jgi:hypothetical protein
VEAPEAPRSSQRTRYLIVGLTGPRMGLLLGEHDAQIHGRLLPDVISAKCSLACPPRWQAVAGAAGVDWRGAHWGRDILCDIPS